MKSIREFMVFTNLKGHVKSFVIILLLLSFLYCSVYTITTQILYKMDSSLLYYLGLYVLVIGSTYVYMIILFQFIKSKREDTRDYKPKTYFAPLFVVQSIYFVLLSGGGILSYACIANEQLALNAYLVSPILILFIMFYIPMQIFSILYIYDGHKNGLRIIKDSFLKILHHYQSVFYSFLVIGCLYFAFLVMMNSMFGMTISLLPASFAMNIMTMSNPFITLFQFMGSVLDNMQIAVPALISLCYGILMCFALTYYYMVMICIYDNDIKA